MEWLENQVAVAFTDSPAKPKRLKYLWNNEEIEFFLKKSKSGTVLLVYIAGVERVEPNDTFAAEIGPTVLVKSTLSGLPNDAPNCDSIYFMKNIEGVISSNATANQAIDYGVIKKSSLQSLASIVSNVYGPGIFTVEENRDKTKISSNC